MSNMRQIARLAGVSLTTVSLALRDHSKVTPQTREKVKEIARQLNYVPPAPHCRQFTDGKVIGYLIHDNFGIVATDILRGAMEEARHFNLGILMMQVKQSSTWIEEAVHSLLDMGISGLVLAHSFAEPLPRGILFTLRSRGIHVVQIMNKLFTDFIDSACRDEQNYATVAAAHLAERGHRRVLGLGLFGQQVWHQQFAAQGVALTTINPMIGAEMTQEAFKAFLKMRPRPTACVLAVDDDAFRFTTLCKLHGLTVPGDISVMGMGNILGTHAYPDVTTIDMQAQEMGRVGIRLLSERIAAGTPPHEITAFHDLLLPAQVIDRGSTGPAKQ